MRKIFLLFLLIPSITRAGLEKYPIFNNSNFLLTQKIHLDFMPISPHDIFKDNLPRAIYPWGVAVAAVLVGGGIAYYGSYKDILPLSIAGGVVALAGGVLAVVSLSPYKKYIRLSSTMEKKHNTSLSLANNGLGLTYRF